MGTPKGALIQVASKPPGPNILWHVAFTPRSLFLFTRLVPGLGAGGGCRQFVVRGFWLGLVCSFLFGSRAEPCVNSVL